jgi:hypothetical protein
MSTDELHERIYAPYGSVTELKADDVGASLKWATAKVERTSQRGNGDRTGTVEAFFADGSSATGDVLVAADGANSAVRQQYLPHATVSDTGIIAIGGKVPITAETKPLLPHNCFQGLSLVFAPKGRFCIWHVMEFTWDTKGQVKGGIGGNDAELIQGWPGLLFDNTRDYINWGFWASSDKYPPGVMDLRGEDLIRLVLDVTPGWHPNMRRLFGPGRPGSCSRSPSEPRCPSSRGSPATSPCSATPSTP